MGHYFPAPNSDASLYCNKPAEFDALVAQFDSLVSAELLAKLEAAGRIPSAGDVKYVFLTKSGPGPIAQPVEESLLDPKNGQPVEPSSKHRRMKLTA
jgi:hypothetical protein